VKLDEREGRESERKKSIELNEGNENKVMRLEDYLNLDSSYLNNDGCGNGTLI
jgi:hypothetical protein